MKYILQWNAGGLVSHLPEFKQYIQKSSPLIAAIQETHFRDSDVYNFDIPGFSLYQNNVNAANRQGGTALYVKNDVPHRIAKLKTPLNADTIYATLFHCEMLIMSL